MNRYLRPAPAKDRLARRAAFDLGTEGAVFSEYAVVMGVCGLVISFAILLLGAPLVDSYYQNRQIVIAPVP